MRRVPSTLVLMLALSLAGCQSYQTQRRAQESAPHLSSSAQIQRKFFVCKDLIGDDWIPDPDFCYMNPQNPTCTYSTDDPAVIVVARLDKDSLDSRLTMEITSPEDKVIEVETRTFTQLRDVGIRFSPTSLLEKGGGAGRYRAKYYVDALFVGEVPFFIEDRRGVTQEALDPTLKEVEWQPEDFE